MLIASREYRSHRCSVTTIPMAVTFRTCHAVYCVRANEQWDMFHDDVDDVVPLAVRHISHDEIYIEPHEDVTWVKKYEAQDLR